MNDSLDRHDRQFLQQLHRIGVATVQEMCDVVGVTATAIRQRLTRLQAAGLVARETVRQGRGRPHYRYEVTNSGLKVLGDNYADLAQVLWRSIKSIKEEDVQERVISRVRDELFQKFSPAVQKPTVTGRMEQLQEALVDHGFDVEIDFSSQLPILRENNCPYPELAESDASICQLEQEVFQRLLGTRVELTQCCLDGHHCCEFTATAD